MVYRFIILSDEVDNFRRDITIDSDATFIDLHDAILDSVGFTKDQMTSFFICDDDWAKKTEITLIEMDSSTEEDNYVMDETRLSDLLEDEKQKLIFVFDNLTERLFFMELREIIPSESLKKAKVIRTDGNAPSQILSMDELDNAIIPNIVPETDDDFYNNEINLDEYDEEDMGNLMDDNSLW